MVWSLALCPDDAKQDPVVYGAENKEVFLAKSPRTGSIQEGLDCLGLYHSGLKEERLFWLVLELTKVPFDAHSACMGPPGDFSGRVRGFGNGARQVGEALHIL